MTQVLTRDSYRDIDADSAFALLRPVYWELGVRDRRLLTRSDAPQLGRWIEFKIGMGHSTCDVAIRLTHLDLFDVTISKTRKVKGDRCTKVLGQALDIYAGDLSRVLLNAWCLVCSEKGW